jgi:hypothetical protein
MELNKPVENPALVAAIADFGRNPTAETQEGLTRALKAAKYLVPFIGDGKSAEAAFQPGSRLKFPQLTLSDGTPYVPVFTEWGEVRKWTDVKIDTVILSVGDLHALFGASAELGGIVLNVGSDALVLKKPHLAALGATDCAGL